MFLETIMNISNFQCNRSNLYFQQKIFKKSKIVKVTARSVWAGTPRIYSSCKLAEVDMIHFEIHFRRPKTQRHMFFYVLTRKFKEWNYSLKMGLSSVDFSIAYKRL